MILLNFLIAILFYNSVVVTEARQKTFSFSTTLEHLKSLPSSLLEIEDVPRPLFLRRFTMFEPVNKIYRQLNVYKQSSDNKTDRSMNLWKFAETVDQRESKIILDCVKKIVGMVILHCQRYIPNMVIRRGIMRKCDESKGQSLNYIVYSTFQYISSVIKKAYSILVQTRIIHNENSDAWSNVYKPGWNSDFKDPLIDSYKRQYETTTKKIISVFKNLANAASTRIASCEQNDYPINGKTYLEMVKFLQGIFPQEITLNKKNSGRGTCTDYKDQGTAYYPYKNIKHDGDWKCHGLMYECFQVQQEMDICKPSNPNRRLDGIVHDGLRMMGYCYSNDKWTLSDWRYPMPFSFYQLEQCACICDDFDHPRTLRRFSREYVMSDYKNNRVVTGIRLVKISNVIHIEIQQGKLEKFGFINSSTVQWKLNNNIANHSADLGSKSSDKVITLSYQKRRVNLDVIHLQSNEVVIGAAFGWTQEMDGIELIVFATNYSFYTGELNQNYHWQSAPYMQREEIILEGPNMPKICKLNMPVGGNNKFIKFQTTDWIIDAAQTTIPHLDIQEVVTNPPAMLRGLGLYYKNRRDCGGYIGLELHSRRFDDLISSPDKIFEHPRDDRVSRRP